MAPSSFSSFLFTGALFLVAYSLSKLQPKKTNLTIYVHDYLSGPDASAISVAGKTGANSDVLQFGTLIVVDDVVTEGPGVDSKAIGRAQGMYINSALDGKGLHLVFSVVFTEGEFKGSSLEIQGADLFSLKEREFSVVSGTGYFSFTVCVYKCPLRSEISASLVRVSPTDFIERALPTAPRLINGKNRVPDSGLHCFTANKMATGQLFSRNTQALFYNYKQLPIQRMLDFDFLCGREIPSVAGIINPGAEGFQKLFFGQEEIAIPVHSSIDAACSAHPTADVFINFASFRSAAASSMAALKQPTIRVVAIIAEGVPESDTKQLIAYARSNNKVVIGPATVGGIQAGAFKIGDTAGTIDNIIQCKLFRPGSVGFVSKSGGMSNELYNTIARVTDGIYEGIAIGGDVFPGSTLSDHVLRFNNIPQVKMMVVLGELGGQDEYSLVEALKQGKVQKPVVAWVSGTCARLFKSEVQFGHAGAKSGGELESAQAKNQALRGAGAVVPTSFEAFEDAIKETFEKLVDEGKISPVSEVKPPQIPEDLNFALKSGKVRAPTHIISTISDDRGEEPCYSGVPMSTIVERGYGVGDVISLLWFKRSLPRYCTQFIEICIMLCADHGPCVSGAHNTIVTARAGKDLVSSLVSGLLTIGPRFGGAIDDAARYFKDAYDRGLSAYEFVESMKKKGIRVPGIGHRIKRGDNRDKRVELLQKYAHTHFPSVKYMEYAVQVETYTLSKANNLVLNVDGAIGSLFLDLLAGSGMFSKQEIDEIVEIGYLNGLFVLARSIGLIGHTFDQKRLKQPLYRHPWEDVLYTK
ncbi:hypothetical protein H6P81_002345 [Aristolochia fimbriata]|nr:hypothetical protein H6P81_002345 [Aristolochia fimbriata]